MPPVRSRFVVRTFATFVLFTLVAGQFWRNLLDWWGWGAIALVLLVGSIVGLVRLRPDWMWRAFPKSLVAFLGLATLSLAWSFYPGASAIGIALQWATTLPAVFLALALTWAELLRAFSVALRWVLGLSLLFELWVGIFVRHAVLPFWVDYGTDTVPQAFYWSRGLLLQGGPIEGIVASRNLLGFLALLAVIVFAVQLAAGTVRRGWGIAWLSLAVLMLVLTRSATVTLAAAAVGLTLVFALWARRAGADGRRPVYLTAGASVLAAAGALIAFTPQLLGLFGKSSDLTGRFDIWASVTGLAAQRPVQGWGWVSYWAPWVEPFDGLAVRKGVVYLQAHNAWLDVWLQLGIIGLIVFSALVLSTLWRSWFLAVDRPRHGLADKSPYTASALLPLLLLAALLAQSVAESRMLVEFGWVILCVLALMTKRQQASAAPMP
ncbi:O-Antigen ligase [Cryobacterium psychrotolerans]|uniref:O-Antigen ligase n=1 Tax=Cryobacterium psychrotolerans TaxID=386301 RepID=A0A1G9CI08_9MICO|nr:O-antigen ligase family protein [Cryobacterium psychrotolerans]TFD84279.1 O-antigen ligase family protein [Cryobacterium psychrotolerans]SDK51236.1 O-Antigen ligase [Cryobacterium psychrotolerans]